MPASAREWEGFALMTGARRGVAVSHNGLIVNHPDAYPVTVVPAATWRAMRRREKELRALAFAVADEAHTMGRIYTKGGEKLKPAEQYEIVAKMVRNALRKFDALARARQPRRSARGKGER